MGLNRNRPISNLFRIRQNSPIRSVLRAVPIPMSVLTALKFPVSPFITLTKTRQPRTLNRAGIITPLGAHPGETPGEPASPPPPGPRFSRSPIRVASWQASCHWMGSARPSPHSIPWQTPLPSARWGQPSIKRLRKQPLSPLPRVRTITTSSRGWGVRLSIC